MPPKAVIKVSLVHCIKVLSELHQQYLRMVMVWCNAALIPALRFNEDFFRRQLLKGNLMSVGRVGWFKTKGKVRYACRFRG